MDIANACLQLGDAKTGASIRPLPSAALAILNRIRRQGDFVFPGVTRSDKSYASVLPKAWRRIVGSAYSPHGLRHAYASAAHELDLGELMIKARLGHARVGITSGYIARLDSLVLAAADKVASYIAAAMIGERGKLLPLTAHR